MNNTSDPPFFIIGSQRSGTTLLRLMLNAHSKIAIPEEGGFWMPMLRDYRKKKVKIIDKDKLRKYIEYLYNNPQFSLWNIDAAPLFDVLREKEITGLKDLMDETYSAFARANGKQVWGDKTPSFFRMVLVLNDLFPDSRFIHLVRDGRDTYLSLRSMDSSRRNLSVQALEWIYKVRKAKIDLKGLKPDKVLEIRYEDLVNEPEKKLIKICRFLSIEYEPEMLNYWESSDRYIGKHHSKLIFRPVSKSSIKKWKKDLTEAEILRFESIAGSTLKRYGYELTNKKEDSFKNNIRLLIELLYGLPLRAAQIVIFALNYYLSAKYGIVLFNFNVGEPPEKVLLKNKGDFIE